MIKVEFIEPVYPIDSSGYRAIKYIYCTDVSICKDNISYFLIKGTVFNDFRVKSPNIKSITHVENRT